VHAKWLVCATVAATLGSGERLTQTSAGAGTVRITGGSFRMGTAADALPGLKRRYGVNFPGVFESELPEHLVTVSDFRLDQHEVTNAQFAAFVEARPDWRKDRVPPQLQNDRYLEAWKDGRPAADRADHPLVFVTWHAAQAFCRWAGGRLPTEAEWEYAARNGQALEFPWGDNSPNPLLANYSASTHHDTVAVGSYPPTSSGLHDLAGNVWEFVLDPWQPTYPDGPVADPLAGGPIADDQLLTVTGRRVIRGGSFGAAPVNLRTRWRDSHVVTNAVEFVGFRCAYPLAPQ
jgi:iron(II)-dependent oxidoreductase